MKIYIIYDGQVAKSFSRSLRVAKEEARKIKADEIQEVHIPDRKGDLTCTTMRRWRRYQWGVPFYEYPVK